MKKDKIGILFLVDQIERSTAGSEQHLSFLLKNIPRDRYRVFLALLRKASGWDRAAYPVKPIYLGLNSFYRPNEIIRAAAKLSSIIRKERIDIVHTFFPDSELLGVIARTMNKRVCLISARRNMGYWHNRLSLLRARIVNRFIPHFVANCQAVKQAVAKLENIPLSKIHVIYNPINRERLDDGFLKKMSRADLGIKNGHPIIGMVANVRLVKNHECFLRASRLVADKDPNARFIVVGSGSPESKKSLHNLISDLDLVDSVIDVGEQDNPIPVIRLFDVGVLSSNSEGLSNTLIEYGAVGVPAVATDVGGNAEVVKEGVTGFLVPASSPLALGRRVLELLENEELRRLIAKAAEKFVLGKFREGKIISSYDQYYIRILGGSRAK